MFPTLSVTAIGLIVGAASARHGYWPHLAVGLLGAWFGFAVGALIGVMVDVAFATGVWVALVGHALALAGAAVAVRRLLARQSAGD